MLLPYIINFTIIIYNCHYHHYILLPLTSPYIITITLTIYYYHCHYIITINFTIYYYHNNYHILPLPSPYIITLPSLYIIIIIITIAIYHDHQYVNCSHFYMQHLELLSVTYIFKAYFGDIYTSSSHQIYFKNRQCSRTFRFSISKFILTTQPDANFIWSVNSNPTSLN